MNIPELREEIEKKAGGHVGMYRLTGASKEVLRATFTAYKCGAEEAISHLSPLIAEQAARIEKLTEALKIYADPFSWRSNSGKIGITFLTDGRDSELINGQHTNGKLARQALSAKPDAEGKE